MQMQLRHIVPHPQLKGYVDKIWVFESDGRIPSEDMRLIVPNGRVKLTIPYRNGVSGKNKEMYHLSKESQITLIGIGDIPAIIDLEQDAPSGNIGIEFSPLGAYRIFQLRQVEIKNRIFLLEDVLGKTAKNVQEIIANYESVDQKIKIIQQYLIKLLSKTQPDPLLDFCITEIKQSQGSIAIATLQSKTGYSSRWLHNKFVEKVGVGTKNFSSIIRFLQFYEPWARSPDFEFKNDLYNYFYDQAHFIKEFRRFTGMSPLKFTKSENEFGKIFYKE